MRLVIGQIVSALLLSMPAVGQDNVHVWIRAFIPSDAGYARDGQPGHKIFNGRSGCFATSGRQFSQDPSSSSLLVTDFVLTVSRNGDTIASATAPPIDSQVSLSMPAVDCTSGAAVQAIDVPSTIVTLNPVIKAATDAAPTAVEVQVSAIAGPSNPLPTIGYQGTIRYVPAWNRLEFDSAYFNDFPAYEAYAQLNNGPIQQLLNAEAPAQVPATSPLTAALHFTTQLGPINLTADQVNRTVWTSHVAHQIASKSAWEQTVLAAFAYFAWQPKSGSAQHPNAADAVSALTQVQASYLATSASASGAGMRSSATPPRMMYAMHQAIAASPIAQAFSASAVQDVGIDLLSNTRDPEPKDNTVLAPGGNFKDSGSAQLYQQKVWENVWDLAKRDPDFSTTINTVFASGSASLLAGANTSSTASQIAALNADFAATDGVKQLLSGSAPDGSVSLAPDLDLGKLVQTQVLSPSSNTTVVNINFLNDPSQPKPDPAKDQQIITAGRAGVNAVSSILKVVGLGPASTEVTKVGSAVIDVADAVSKFSDTVSKAGSILTGIGSLGGAVATGNVLGAVVGLFSAFGGGPSVDQEILDQVKQLQDSVNKMNKIMQTRFDQVDKEISGVSDQMTKGFQEIDSRLGTINGSVIAIQNSLISQNARLDQLQSTILRAMDDEIGYLQDSQKLNCLERKSIGPAMSAAEYSNCASLMEAIESRQSLDPTSTIPALANRINALPGGPFVNNASVPDLDDWITGTESYISIASAWPQLFGSVNVSPTFAGNAKSLAAVIKSFASDSQTNKSNHRLFDALFKSYNDALKAVTDSINPPPSSGDADTWGGTGQVSVYSPQSLPNTLVRVYIGGNSPCPGDTDFRGCACTEGTPGVPVLIAPPGALVDAIPSLARLAEQLGVGTMRFMFDYSPTQSADNYEGVFENLRHELPVTHNGDGDPTAYRMDGIPRLKFRGVIDSGASKRSVFWSGYAQTTVQNAGTNFPKPPQKPYPEDCAVFNPLIDFSTNPPFAASPADQGLVSSGLSAISSQVAQKLRVRQQTQYSGIIGSVLGTNPVTGQSVGKTTLVTSLDAARKDLVAAIALGLGYSALENEQLRSLISSDPADTASSIVGVASAVPGQERNDVLSALQAACASSCTAGAGPPDHDLNQPSAIVQDMQSRAARLKTVVDGILSAIDAGTITEGSPRFDDTARALTALINSHP